MPKNRKVRHWTRTVVQFLVLPLCKSIFVEGMWAPTFFPSTVCICTSAANRNSQLKMCAFTGSVYYDPCIFKATVMVNLDWIKRYIED